MDNAWALFRMHSPHDRVVKYLCRVKLYDVMWVGRMQYNRSLLKVMIDRWRLESHYFHLLFGEVTITLHDVQVMFGLRINGRLVYVQDAAQRNYPWRTILQRLTGYDGNIIGRSRMTIHSITRHIQEQLAIDLITHKRSYSSWEAWEDCLIVHACYTRRNFIRRHIGKQGQPKILVVFLFHPWCCEL